MKLTKPQQKMLAFFGAFSFFWGDPGKRGRGPARHADARARGPVLRRLLAKGAVVQTGQYNLGPRYGVTDIGRAALDRAHAADHARACRRWNAHAKAAGDAALHALSEGDDAYVTVAVTPVAQATS